MNVDGQFFVDDLNKIDQGIVFVRIQTDVLSVKGFLYLGSVWALAIWLYNHHEACNPDEIPRSDQRFENTHGTYFGWADEAD